MGKYCPPNNTPCQEYFFETVFGLPYGSLALIFYFEESFQTFNINVRKISQLVDKVASSIVSNHILRYFQCLCAIEFTIKSCINCIKVVCEYKN